jgi:hypothetical protein
MESELASQQENVFDRATDQQAGMPASHGDPISYVSGGADGNEPGRSGFGHSSRSDAPDSRLAETAPADAFAGKCRPGERVEQVVEYDQERAGRGHPDHG